MLWRAYSKNLKIGRIEALQYVLSVTDQSDDPGSGPFEEKRRVLSDFINSHLDDLLRKDMAVLVRRNPPQVLEGLLELVKRAGEVYGLRIRDPRLLQLHIKAFLALSYAYHQDVESAVTLVVETINEHMDTEELDQENLGRMVRRFIEGEVADPLSSGSLVADSPTFREIVNILLKAMVSLKEDETIPGRISALFYDEDTQQGRIKKLVVHLNDIPDESKRDTDNEAIVYTDPGAHSLDGEIPSYAKQAKMCCHNLLIERGYEGLHFKSVQFQILESRYLKRTHISGGSLALPLAVGILSRYLSEGRAEEDRKVLSNNIALTGALNIDRDVLAVDGINQKIEEAIKNGCERIIYPLGNREDLSPNLRQRSEQREVDLIPVASLDTACEELNLFDPPPSNRIKDISLDILKEIGTFFNGESPSRRNMLLLTIAFSIMCACSNVSYAFFQYTVEGISLFWRTSVVSISILIVFLTLIVCYGLARPFVERNYKLAFPLTFTLVKAANVASYFLLLQVLGDQPGYTSTGAVMSSRIDVLVKYGIYTMYSIVMLVNTYGFITNLDYLIERKGMLRTVTRLTSDEFNIGLNTPLCFYRFHHRLATNLLMAGGFFLLYWNAQWYISDAPNRYGHPSAIVVVGFLRDFLFIAVGWQTLGWYKTELSRLKARVS